MSEMNRHLAISNGALAIAVSCLLASLPLVASGQDIRNSARDRARKGSSEPILRPAPPSDFARKSIAEMAKEALLVVEGRLWRGQTFLPESDDRVLTEYVIVVTNLLAGELPGKDRVSIPLTVTMRGGEVVVEGIVVRESDGNYRDELLDGGEYLLFLRTSRPPVDGRYEVYNGGIFQITDDHARSLRRTPPQEVGGDTGLAFAKVRSEVSRGRAAR